MPIITHTTALLIAPASKKGATADLYRNDPGEGSLLGLALAEVGSWPVDRIVLVLGDDAETLLEDVTEGIEVLIDPEWPEGPAAALRSGFDLVVRSDESEAVIVASLDRPIPDAELIQALLDTARTSTRPIAAPKYRYSYDFPYLIHSELWVRILGMEGSASLPALVATHPEWIAEAWIDSVPPTRYESAEDLGVRR
jgi:CTP:molybdopterin cytidylyltransferase MocA